MTDTAPPAARSIVLSTLCSTTSSPPACCVIDGKNIHSTKGDTVATSTCVEVIRGEDKCEVRGVDRRDDIQTAVSNEIDPVYNHSRSWEIVLDDVSAVITM